AVPGLDGTRSGPMTEIEVNFGGVPLRYDIGGASVAVPGVPAGCGELHARWGRLPWRDVVQPAIELAKRGAPFPDAQARALRALTPVMTRGDGALAYAPNGRLLQGGELLYHPGLAEMMELLAEHGPTICYTGEIADLMVAAARR